MISLNEKLLQLHGITKQLKIRLFRINLDTDTTVVKGLLSRNNAYKKQKSKPKSRNPCQKENPYRCPHPKCNYQNKRYCRITEHMIIHSKEKQFKCKVCSKAFKTTGYLKSHLRVHLTSEEKKFLCSEPDCKFKSALKCNLKLHMLTHSTEKPFKRQVCNGFFKTAATLQGHLVTHSDERKFVCSFPGCSSTFRQSSALDVHTRLHLSSEKPYECTVCGWRSRYKHCVKNHMVSLHGAEGKKYKCEKCGHISSSWGRREAHCLRMHPESREREREKRFKCSQCNFAAFYPGQLKSHARIHSETKPYSCFSCEYKTADFCLLDSHIRRHTGEKPYACSKCDFRAASSKGVSNHFNVHHNEARQRNHKCEFCSRAFFTRTELNRHVWTHTGEKPICIFCGKECTRSRKTKHSDSCPMRPENYLP